MPWRRNYEHDNNCLENWNKTKQKPEPKILSEPTYKIKSLGLSEPLHLYLETSGSKSWK